MNFLSLIGVELKKIRRSKIFLILLIPVIIMWIPSVINADMNFDLKDIPIRDSDIVVVKKSDAIV